MTAPSKTVKLRTAATNPRTVILYGPGLTFTHVFNQSLGLKDSKSSTYTPGTVQHGGAWARGPKLSLSLPLWQLLKAIRDYLESKAQD